MSISHGSPVSTLHLELHCVAPRRLQHRQQLHENPEVPRGERRRHGHLRRGQLPRDTIIYVPRPLLAYR